MQILAFLTDPPVVRSVLLHLDLPHKPPPLAPARRPPQGDLLLDHSPASDAADTDPEYVFDQSGTEFDFDQSVPDPIDD